MTLHTVLGASGLIGAHLANFLQTQGLQVSAIKRNDRLDLERPLGHVYYCIGISADFRKRLSETVHAHINVFQNVLENGKFDSLVYLSSTRVYQGANKTNEAAELSVNPTRFDHLYNISKLMGESLCLTHPSRQVRAVRLSNVITSFAALDSPNFFDTIVQEAVNNKYVELQTGMNSQKDYIDIEDVSSMLLKIALYGKQKIYNLARGENTTTSVLIELIRKFVDFDVAIAPDALDTVFEKIDVDLIRSEFDFSPIPIVKTLSARMNSY